METCQFLGITRQTLYSWIQQKKIKPWRKMGGRTAWFFFKKDVVKAKGQKYKQDKKRS
jgi:excisionase family DNA binding protein